MSVQELLWEWAGKMAMLCVVIASYVAVWYLAKWRERLDRSRREVLSAVERAIAETVVIPRPRQDVDQ